MYCGCKLAGEIAEKGSVGNPLLLCVEKELKDGRGGETSGGGGCSAAGLLGGVGLVKLSRLCVRKVVGV